jgi:hypothetical protein
VTDFTDNYRTLDCKREIEASNDLNTIHYLSADSDGAPKDHSFAEFQPALIKPVFRDIEKILVKEIKGADTVVGCVAWLASIPILEALCEKDGVQIVLQQEDWLRPDSDDWALQKQKEYINRLRGITNFDAAASWGTFGNISPIRLSGKPKNSTRNHARMHNKFLVFGRRNAVNEFGVPTWHRVWTGSYNLTRNAVNSLENGLLIESEAVALAYWREWRQILLSSFRVQDAWYGEEYAWSAADDEYLREGT